MPAEQDHAPRETGGAFCWPYVHFYLYFNARPNMLQYVSNETRTRTEMNTSAALNNWMTERRQQGFNITSEIRDGQTVYTAEKMDGEFWVFGGSMTAAGRLISWY